MTAAADAGRVGAPLAAGDRLAILTAPRGDANEEAAGLPAFPTSASTSGEFARGWRIVLLALAGAATTASVTLLYSLGTLVLPLQQAFGWSRADLQLTIAFMSGGVVVASQLAGWCNLRFGMRRMALVSLVGLALALFATTQIAAGSSIGWLYVAYFLAPIAGTGITFVTWTQLVSHWFDRQRGLALALVLCGSGLSAAILPLLLAAAIERWDWRAGFIVLGALPLLLTWPIALAWFRASPGGEPERAGHAPTRGVTGAKTGSKTGAPASLATGSPTAAAAAAATPTARDAVAAAAAVPDDFRSAVRSRKFWTLNVALTLVVSAIVGMVTNTVPLLRDTGLSAQQAGSVFGSFGIALITGRVAAGWLIDRLWAPGVAAVALALPSIGCLLLWNADAGWSTAWLVLAVGLVGVGTGAEFDLSAYLVSRYFGLQHYGRLFGIHLGLITAGSMLAPLLFAAMYKASGGYGPMLAYGMVCCVVGPLLLLTLGRMPARLPVG